MLGGGSNATLSAAPSSMKRSTPQKLKSAGRRLLIDNKDRIVPDEATWSKQEDNKWAWATSIKKQTGGQMVAKDGPLVEDQNEGGGDILSPLLPSLLLVLHPRPRDSAL
jgi:hypothetical protein